LTSPFLLAKRDTVNRFLRGWIEGIRVATSDKETTVSIMEKFLETSDRSVLERIFEIYKSVHERVPTPDAKLMAVALKQLAASVQQKNPLNVEDFTDCSTSWRVKDLLPKSTKPADGVPTATDQSLTLWKISRSGRNTGVCIWNCGKEFSTKGSRSHSVGCCSATLQ
jgi:hypothetical protein